MPGPRVLEQLERAVVNGSWTEEWNPEEMPRRGTRPKQAEGIISTQCFFLVKSVISSPVSPNSPSYRSQGQTSIKLAPAIWTETCFLQEGSGRGKYPPDVRPSRWAGARVCVCEFVQLLNGLGWSEAIWVELWWRGEMTSETGGRRGGKADPRVTSRLKLWKGQQARWNLLWGLRRGVTKEHASPTVLLSRENVTGRKSEEAIIKQIYRSLWEELPLNADT